MSYNISIYDFTSGTFANLPMLPVDGEFTLERGQGYTAFGILGSPPHIQFTAPTERKFTMALDLWGDEGEAFYVDFLEPAYGGRDGTYRPHLLQVSWGARADKVFQGRPAGGLPPTRHQLGAKTGEIFARTFELVLVEVKNQTPRVIEVKTGNVTNSTQLYTTRDGDDLGTIAKKFKTTVKVLAQLNGGNPPFKLPVGTPLVVPRV